MGPMHQFIYIVRHGCNVSHTCLNMRSPLVKYPLNDRPREIESFYFPWTDYLYNLDHLPVASLVFSIQDPSIVSQIQTQNIIIVMDFTFFIRWRLLKLRGGGGVQDDHSVIGGSGGMPTKKC